jgi:hypothetical protein
MKSFLIEFDYEGSHCECFVQKLVCDDEELFLLSFKDASLIQRFKGKKLLLSAGNKKDIATAAVWNAIKQHDIYTT